MARHGSRHRSIGGPCATFAALQYCGQRFKSEDLTFDHVVPRSRGGRASWTNIVTACMACNVAKGNRSVAECGLRPLAMPAVPTARQLYENGRKAA